MQTILYHLLQYSLIVSCLFTLPVFSQTLFSDFQVNDNVIVSFIHSDPAIAVAENGDFIVTWLDERSGQNIFAQRFSADGIPIGNNILVNDDTNNRRHFEPVIDVDTNGDFVIAWVDERRNFSTWRLYLQRFNSEGQALGSNMPIDVNVFSLFNQRYPAVAYGDSGSIIVVWNESLDGTYNDIAMRRIDSDGIYLGDVVQVNDDFSDITHQHAAIASNKNGEFVIAWHDYRIDFNWGDIYYQRFDSDAVSQGVNKRVNDDPIGGFIIQRDPAIALNDSGKFVVCWADQRNGNYDIYAQRYDSDEQLLGNNFRVDDDPDSLDQSYPKVALKSDGSFLMTWDDKRNEGDIYSQFFDSSGNISGINFIVNDDTTGIQAFPDMGIDENDRIVRVWQDYRNSFDTPDIYLQKSLANGTPDGADIKIYDETWNSLQQKPKVKNFSNGNRIIVWQDSRSGALDLYAQVYDSEINPVGANVKINTLGIPFFNASPDIAVDADNMAFIIWSNSYFLGSIYRIKGQFITDQGELSGTNITIDSLDNSAEIVAVDFSNGEYIVTWGQQDGADPGNIFVRRFDENGNPLGDRFKVNDDPGSINQNSPTIAVDDRGDLLIAWTDLRNGAIDIYAQLFDSEGVLINNNFMINEDIADSNYFSPNLAAIDSNRFAVAYIAYRSGVSKNINLQYLESDGTFIGNPQRANDLPGSYQLGFPVITSGDSSKIIITWEDLSNDRFNIFGQRFVFDSKVDNNFFIATQIESEQKNSDVNLFNGEIFTVWEDNRIEKLANNIYANVLDFGNTHTTNIIDDTKRPGEFTLHQNYPNPFNPKTIISWQLSISSRVDLSIYSTLGEKVAVLVLEKQKAGYHQIEWDARGFASGVYYYRLSTNAGFVRTRKLVLIK
jgi:hypothetical protein